MRKCALLLAGASTLVSGCATLPANVGVTYFHPQLDARMVVTETIACDKANHVIAAASAAPTAVYSAGEPARALYLDSLRGDLSDTKLTFDFTDDGRLKDINTSSTGEGEAILTSAIKLVTDVALAGGPFLAAVVPVKLPGAKPTPPNSFPKECALINGWNKGDPITLTYASDLNFATPVWVTERTQLIDADAASTPRYDLIKAALGVICVSLDPPATPGGIVQRVQTSNGYVNGPRVGWLELKQPASVTAHAYVQRSGGCGAASDRKVFWNGAFSVSQLGTKFYVPIPKAEALGNHTFALALSDSGSITKLEYDTDTGAKSAATVAASAADQLTPANRAQMYDDARKEKAAHDKWIACEADATKCAD